MEVIETDAGLSQKLNAEIYEIREKWRSIKCLKRKQIGKKLGRSSICYKAAKIVCSLPKQQRTRARIFPVEGKQLTEDNLSGEGIKHKRMYEIKAIADRRE